MYDEEKWLRYPHNWNYAVSSWGRIVKLINSPRSPKRLLKIKTPVDGNPVFCSILSKYLGAIVLETFQEPEPSSNSVGYRDGDKQNNHLQNLYWKGKDNETNNSV